MLLAAIILVLVFAVALVQATQGWYSAMIMAVLTMTCAALAFGTYDFVAVNYLAPYWKPSYAHAIALTALFGVPLIVLRLIFDRTIRRTTLLPLMIDRIGGGICGLITALTMVGMLAVTMYLIPFDRGSLLGYSRVEVADPAADKPSGMGQNGLWLSPDRFAASLGTMLSAGIYGSGSSLYKDHPDLVQEAAWTNAVPAGMSRYAAPGSISVVGTELVPVLYTVVPGRDPKKDPPDYQPLDPAKDSEFRMVKVRLGDKAKDERKSHLFTLRQFRLAGRKPGSASMMEVHAIGLEQEQNDPTKHYIRFKKGRTDMPVVDNTYSPKGGDTVEVVFEVPKNFQPTHVSYKRGAQAPVSFDGSSKSGGERLSREKGGEAAAPKPAAPATVESKPAAPSTEAAAPRPGRGGNIRGITSKAGRSFFGDELPLELKNYRGVNLEHKGSVLASGSLVAELDKQAEGSSEPLRRFAVPDDQRLLQLSISKLEAKSTFGRIIAQAVQTVENYYVTDSNGNRYEVVGKYAVASVNGTDTMELQYFGGAEAGIGRMHPFDRIKSDHLKGEYAYVLLFLVKPGATITGFSTGGDATRADDLTAENLKAPQ